MKRTLATLLLSVCLSLAAHAVEYNYFGTFEDSNTRYVGFCTVVEDSELNSFTVRFFDTSFNQIHAFTGNMVRPGRRFKLEFPDGRRVLANFTSWPEWNWKGRANYGPFIRRFRVWSIPVPIN